MAEEIGTTKGPQLNYIKYIALLVIIIIIPIVLEFDLQGKKLFEKNTMLYLSVLIVPLIFIFCYEFIFQGKKIENKEMLKYFFGVAVIMVIFSALYHQLAAYKEFFTIGFYVSIFLAFGFGVSINSIFIVNFNIKIINI